MSKINDTTDYPVTVPAAGDMLIGTDVSDTSTDAGGETANFTVAALTTYAEVNLDHTKNVALETALYLLEVEGGGFDTLAAAVAAAIPASATRIVTKVYSTATGKGGATYKRSDVGEVAAYPALAWFNSADGAYWLLDEAVTHPEMFGAVGDGTADDLPAVQAMLNIGGTALLGANWVFAVPDYRCSTTPTALRPIKITGTRTTDRLTIDNSNTEYGLFVNSSDVTVEGFEIMANASTAIENGTGHKGTCITISEWFTDPRSPEPELVKRTVIRRMRFTRKAGSKAAHAISILARTSGVIIDDCDFIGNSPSASDGYHGDAVLTHWGAHSHGVSTTQLDYDAQSAAFTAGETLTGGTSGATGYIVYDDDAGATGKLWLKLVSGTFVNNEALTDTLGGAAVANGSPSAGLRQSRFEPEHYSYHPNNVRITNCRLRNVGRFIACSASYSIHADGIDYLGPVQGGQLIDLPIGDEGSTFAHPDDSGRVYTDFSFKNITGKMMTGTGANAVTVIDCSGFSTSKQTDADLAAYASAPYAEEPYAGKSHARRRLFEWKTILFDNIQFDAGPATPPSATTLVRMMYLRNLWGQFTFRNIHATARDPVPQILYDGETERFVVGGVVTGGTSGATATLVGLDDNGADGVLFFSNVSGIFQDGEALTGSLNGAANADGGLTFGPEVKSLELVNVVGNYNFEDCTLVGGVAGDAAENVHFKSCNITNKSTDAGTQSILWDGARNSVTADGPVSAGATVIPISSGCPVRLLVGQRLSFVGGMVTCAEYAETGDVAIRVTPLPIDLADAQSVTIDQWSRNVSFADCDIQGGDEGYSVARSIGVKITGGSVNGAGQYGILANTDSEVYVTGTVFADNGHRRLVDGGLSTRDIVVNPAATLIAMKCRFEESSLVVYNVASGSGAEKVSLVDCVFNGSPITAKTSFAALTNGQPYVFYNNTDGVGLAVRFNGVWSPSLTLGNGVGALARNVNSATYTIFDDRMMLDWDVSITTLGAETGQLDLGSLPHDVEDGAVGPLLFVSGVALDGSGGCFVRAVGNELRCFEQSTSGASSVQHDNLTSSSRFIGSITTRLS